MALPEGCGERVSSREATENGPTKAERNFLEQLGWSVINLDFLEYMGARGKSKEQEMLRVKLRNAGVEI